MIASAPGGASSAFTKLTTAAIVVGLLGLVVYAGLGRLPLESDNLAIGAALAIGGALLLTRLELGIVLLPILAVAVPFSIGTGTNSTIVANLAFSAVLLVFWITRMLLRANISLVDSPILLPLAGFIGTAVFATIVGEATRDPLVTATRNFVQVQVGGLAMFIFSSAVLLMAMNLLRKLRWVKWLVWTFLALGGVTIAGYLLQSKKDIAGFSTGGLFSLWVISLAVGQLFFNRRLPLWARTAVLVLVSAWVYRRVVEESSWLSGWLPILVAVLTIAFLRSKTHLFLLVAGIACAALLNYGFVERVYTNQTQGRDSQGNNTRLVIWEQSLRVSEGHLLFGTGVAGYALYYMTYFADNAYSTHSNYLDIFSQTGLVGSFFFAWLLLATGHIGLGARKLWPDGFEAGVVNGVLGAMMGVVLAMALGDWVLPFVYNQGIAGFRYTMHTWLFMGVLALMPRLAQERES
jgi:hypothetical protein